jgi:hypothetical protein
MLQEPSEPPALLELPASSEPPTAPELPKPPDLQQLSESPELPASPKLQAVNMQYTFREWHNIITEAYKLTPDIPDCMNSSYTTKFAHLPIAIPASGIG